MRLPTTALHPCKWSAVWFWTVCTAVSHSSLSVPPSLSPLNRQQLHTWASTSTSTSTTSTSDGGGGGGGRRMSYSCKASTGTDFLGTRWARTSGMVCAQPRPERVCIVGAGVAGVHFGWLMRRRGFTHTTVFESGQRLGGKVFTLFGQPHGGGDHNVTREAGAAFLSPDYLETRALIRRFGLNTVPLDVATMMRFHPAGASAGSTVSGSAWFAAWVANITGDPDNYANSQKVAAATERYIALHVTIFGNYSFASRLPPQPSQAKLEEIRGSFADFLQRRGLQVLEPLFYQFFVMQGMGLLSMPAWYILRWVTPASLATGGFGNDPSTPLAMVEQGLGSIVQALAEEVNLDIRLATRVTAVERQPSDRPIRLVLSSDGADGTGTSSSETECDLLALTGPIPEYVRGSEDGRRPPILHPATDDEQTVFGDMSAMQFLVTVASWQRSPAPSAFRALEYWPGAFHQPSEVIVRRNILYAETRRNPVVGDVGGVQSFSYWPAPTANLSTHLASQKKWADAQGATLDRILARYWCDNYYYHWRNDSAIVADGKPWQLATTLQLQPGSNTLYLGGAANYETVEDSLYFNLHTVHRLFDDTALSQGADAPAIEQLVIHVACAQVSSFIAADEASWTSYLESKRHNGFLQKWVLTDPAEDASQQTCTVRVFVHWFSRRLWKAIPPAELNATQQDFVRRFPGKVSVVPSPADGDGFTVVANQQPAWGALLATALPGEAAASAAELNFYSVPCIQVARFIAADNQTWCKTLSEQAGFRRKLTLIQPSDLTTPESNCTIWTLTMWESRELWHAIDPALLGATANEFEREYGAAVPVHRFPTAAGLTVERNSQDSDSAASHPRVRLPAIGGRDVVAYFALKPGDKDVRGSSRHKRFVNATGLLSPALLQIHPEPYEFWFSTETNANLFESDPWKYIPANGGHCTHGIASRNDLTPQLLVDGRVAFTCLNTSRWFVYNGSLYMNSCGMYADFIKNPSQDIAASRSRWKEWFGSATRAGPINDACFQDGGLFDGSNPIADLIPRRCVVN
jgi:uncharacterized protein (TIGR03792 family)